MASNYNNFFFKAVSPKIAYDDYVYGSNYPNSSTAATGTILFRESQIYGSLGSYDGVAFSYSDTLGKKGRLIMSSTNYAGSEANFVNVAGDVAYVAYSSNGIAGSDIMALFEEAFNSLAAGAGPRVSASSEIISHNAIVKLRQLSRGERGNTSIVSGGFPTFPPDMNLIRTRGFVGGEGPLDYSETWTPTTGNITIVGTVVNDSYVLSPLRHGQFFDTFSGPVEKFYWSTTQKTTPPIYTPLASSSYRLSVNQDTYCRVFEKYLDKDESEVDEALTTTYSELS